jgi:hypothetical protein
MSSSKGTESTTGCSAAGQSTFMRARYRERTTTSTSLYGWKTTTRLQGAWPDEAFGNDIAELGGVRARVISLRALKADKAEVREDSIVASKDRADLVTLSRLS